MYTSPKRNFTVLVLLLSSLALISGCNQNPSRDTSHCRLSGNGNIDRLFAEVEEKFDDEACHYSWPSYQRQLLAAAKGNPAAENEARFAGLLRGSIERGIISRRQGQELFSRYFDAEFYSVKTEPRSSCASLRRKSAMYADMSEELAMKREGMLEILNDEERFRQAQRHYADLRLVFDAVEVACGQDI